MAWTAPMTAVANNIFTAAQFNTNVRDNLLETAPAKASTAGGYFVATGTNSISQRTASQAYIDTAQTTTSTSFTNLTTVGPSVTVTTGTQAFVTIDCGLSNSGTNLTWAAFDVSGSTTLAALEEWSAYAKVAAGEEVRSSAHYFVPLTAGSNTFTMKYRVSSGTGTFTRRRITVIPF